MMIPWIRNNGKAVLLGLAIFALIALLIRLGTGTPGNSLSLAKIECNDGVTITLKIVGGSDNIARIHQTKKEVEPFTCSVPTGTYKTASGCKVSSGEGNLKDVEGTFKLAGDPNSLIEISIVCDSSMFDGSLTDKEVFTRTGP